MQIHGSMGTPGALLAEKFARGNPTGLLESRLHREWAGYEREMKMTRPGLLGNFIRLIDAVRAVANQIPVSDKDADMPA